MTSHLFSPILKIEVKIRLLFLFIVFLTLFFGAVFVAHAVPATPPALTIGAGSGNVTIQSAPTFQGTAARTGSGTISSSSTTVTGSGSSFTSQLTVGDWITASSQTKVITAIASDTSLTTGAAFNPAISAGASFTYQKPIARFLDSSSNTKIIVDPSGNMGIGVVNPGNTLDFGSNSTNLPGGIWNSSGNVGIGTTAPAQKLDVNGSIATGGTARIDSSGNLTNVGTYNGYTINQSVGTGDSPTFVNLTLSPANPSITSGSSYITIPNGLYVSGGTPYFQTQMQARGGIHNDSAAALTIAGGTSGYTYFTGLVASNNCVGGAGTTSTAGTGGNTWRLCSSAADGVSSANSWLYLYNGAGNAYQDLAAGNLYASGVLYAHGADTDGRYAYVGGSNASGTWGISVTGNAATATNALQWDGGSTNLVAATGRTSLGLANSATITAGTTAVANQIVLRDSGGYINGNYVNTTDDVSAGTLTYLMGKFGDNYYRSAGAAKVATFISGQAMNINGTSNNITAYTINQNVGTGDSPTFSAATINQSNNLVLNHIRYNGATTMDFTVESHGNWLWKNASAGNNAASLSNGGTMVLRGTLTQSGNPDIAENIPVKDTSIGAGDILSTSDDKSGFSDLYDKIVAKKSNSTYDSTILGIVSLKPGFMVNSHITNADLKPENQPNLRPLTVAGRTPVKVSNINGKINKGDFITSSLIPGVGMKATKAGQVVAKALADFDPSNGAGEVIPCPAGTPSGVVCGRILAFSNISYNDPDIYITSTGNLNITPTYQVKDKNNNLINRIGVFAEGVFGKIKAGLIEAKKIVIDGVDIMQRLNDQQAQINELKKEIQDLKNSH